MARTKKCKEETMSEQVVIATRKSKVIYRDGDRVIKMFDANFSKADILNEALITARVEETDINVPSLLEVSVIDGKWSIVSQYIEGKTLAQLWDENPDKEDEYLDLFVSLQMQVHQQRCPLLNKHWDKMNRKIDETNLDANTKYELHTRLNGLPKRHYLCHGDFNPSNIIIQPDGKVYILDWSHATQGHCCADVARTFLLFSLSGKDQLASKYVNLFCSKTGTSLQSVQQWIPIVAASQMVKGKPEEYEMLSAWANVSSLGIG